MIFESEKRTKAATARPGPRIYTVPSGRPFLTELARALLAGDLPVPGGKRPDALELADVALFLPTRRATRALQEAFLRASDGAALLLPRIRPIAEGADELGILAALEPGSEAAAIPPPISEIERRLVLTTLVLRWSDAMRHAAGPDSTLALNPAAGASTPAQAARLAGELARLMDTVETEGVDLSKLATLVPEALSEHWARTLQFLQIVTDFWPDYLAEKGLTSPMQHRNALIAAEAARLASQATPGAPVIVAGVTGSVPATLELMKVVAGLPNGALVLPALYQELDAESWQGISPGHPEHPQFGLRKLLDALGVAREDVQLLPGAQPSGRQQARARLVSEAMRPAGTTERWHRFVQATGRPEMGEALSGLAVLEAASAEDEAEAVALILREAAETPGRTAALVSPDRLLARRVSARLEAWGLEVDDSAGRPFGKTVTGAFLDLIANAIARRFEPVALMALLRHPLARLGLSPLELRRGARTLELAAFRAPYFGQGLDGIAGALERAQADLRARKRRHRAVQRLGPDDWKAAEAVLASLGRAFQPMAASFKAGDKVGLHALAKAHADTAEAMARTTDGSKLWQGEAGEAASKFFVGLLDRATSAPAMAAVDYPDFYRSLIAEETVRPRRPAHPRIFIWGPLESRLQQPDVVVLGSLNEGTWPQSADPGPWLNRPMRQELGMSALEERIGDAAHIFTSLLGTPRAYLTRAAKVDGVPTVPSRWLLRLQALLEGAGQKAESDQPWIAWAQARNALAGPARPVRAPEPRPALHLRPRQLSVTTVEKWIANPYAVFADRILGLQPLPALGRSPDAALRGQIVHDALGRFAARFPDRLPADIRTELISCADAALAELTGSPRVAAFWAPRFARFAAWFADTEPARRAGLSTSLAELDGKTVLAGPAGPFTLRARADRIDVGPRGLVITDYKTGASIKDLAGRAEKGMAPQLPLEAAIATAGGFAGVAAANVAELRYISTSGGEPPGQECTLNTKDVAALALQARDGLVRLIAAFDQETTPYRALRRLRFTYRFDDYAHLARVAEWSAETVEEA